MGLIESASAEARGLPGLHLYHCYRSCCSARARLVLEEKGLPWTSHHIDLFKKENIDAAFFAINPRGLVPVLVDDGRAVTESDDILLWLEERFPEPSFTPADPRQRAKMVEWVHLAGQAHIPSVKTFAYAKVNAKAAAKTPEETARYLELQRDPELLAFHAAHAAAEFPDDKLAEAIARIDTILTDMGRATAADGWLAGPAYSLADIAWTTAMVTLGRAGFALDNYPLVMEWFARVEARPAWQRNQMRWSEPPAQRVEAIVPDGG